MQKNLINLTSDLVKAIENLQGIVYAYDQGFAHSSLSISNAIRALIHQTQKSDSLVNQLCVAENREFRLFSMVSTMPIRHHTGGMVLFDQCLFRLAVTTSGARCIPIFGSMGERNIPFEEWWNEAVIRDVSSGYDSSIWYTRKELIITHANKEGGAHFDANKSKLEHLGSPNALGWDMLGANEMLHYDQKNATIRQIGYEVLRSLYNHYPKYFSNIFF